MPGHGNHWEGLYELDEFIRERLRRHVHDAKLVCRAPCRDIFRESERSETVACLRYGNERLANQLLIVSNTAEHTNEFFSGYPVLLDGITHTVTVAKVEPWEHGIEGWLQVYVTEEQAKLTLFDTMFLQTSAQLRCGDRVDVSLAGLAYSLAPIQRRSFDVKEGPLWDMQRKRRLEEGETAEEAARPVVIHMTGAAIFLQGEGDARDEGWFQGTIDALDIIEHDGQKIYRLEMVLLRPGDEDFRLPVFASEHVLKGYVPRLGEDVEGTLWLQGRVLGPHV